MNSDAVSADVVVVGGGPAGEVLAGRVAARGLGTVLVERELVGGECSYWGCIPSKTLVRPGDVLAAARRVPGTATAVTGPVDVAAALARRDYMTSSWMDAAQERWLADRGIRLVRGAGRLAGERQGAVDGGPTVTGARPGGRAGHRQQRSAAAGARAGRGPALGQPVGDRGKGDPGPAARPRWRSRRRRAGAGLLPAGHGRGHGRGGRPAPAPAGGTVRRRGALGSLHPRGHRRAPGHP